MICVSLPRKALSVVNISLFTDARTVRTVLLCCLLLLSIVSNFLYLAVSLVGRLARLDSPLLAVMSLSDLALCLCALCLQTSRGGPGPADLYLSFSVRKYQTSFSHQTFPANTLLTRVDRPIPRTNKALL